MYRQSDLPQHPDRASLAILVYRYSIYEFYRVLAQGFGHPKGGRAMGDYSVFAAPRVARGDMPDWYYLINIRNLGTYYHELQLDKVGPPCQEVVSRCADDGKDPDVRPLQVNDPLMCTIWKHLIKGTRTELESILQRTRPHQVAVGMKGGLSILIHGMT